MKYTTRVLCGAALALCACDVTVEDSPVERALEVEDGVETEEEGSGGTRCGASWGCGSNGPVLGSAELGPLSLEGKANDRGFALNPRLEPGPGCRTDEPLLLRIHRGELIATDRYGAMKCFGPALAGSTFWISQADPAAHYRIRIDDVALVPTWPKQPATDSARFEFAPAYALVVDYEKSKEHDGRPKELVPICERRATWGYDNHHYEGPYKAQYGRWGAKVLPWHEPNFWAVIVNGELYDPEYAEVVDPGKSVPWFNIACAGGALSKMKLLGYDPDPGYGAPQTKWPERQATLKMITAKYCDRESHTVAGTPLHWANNRGWEFHSPVKADRIGPVEALWSERGAECLGHTRLHSGRAEVGVLKQLRDQCGLPTCEDLDRERRRGIVWRTNAVDHVDQQVFPLPLPLPRIPRPIPIPLPRIPQPRR